MKPYAHYSTWNGGSIREDTTSPTRSSMIDPTLGDSLVSLTSRGRRLANQALPKNCRDSISLLIDSPLFEGDSESFPRSNDYTCQKDWLRAVLDHSLVKVDGLP